MSQSDLHALLERLRAAADEHQQSLRQLQRAAAAAADAVAAAPDAGTGEDFLAAWLVRLSACTDTDEAVAAITDAAAGLLPTAAGAVSAQGEELSPTVSGAWEDGKIWHRRGPEAHDQRLLESIARRSPQDALRLPFVHLGVEVGELRVWNAPAGAEQQLRALVAAAGLVLSALSMRRRLAQRTVRDALTGLFNRRYMEDTLGREVHRARRQASALGVILCDIDAMGELNARYGQDAGDRLLQAVGGLLQISFRGSDVCCRVDGQRFGIVLPDANLENTERRARELLAGIAEIQLSSRGEALPRFSACAGVASYPIHAESPEQLMAAAESALFLAKQAGPASVQVAEKVE